MRRPTPADPDLGHALRAAQNGDPHGFALLWRGLQPALLRYLRVVIGDQAEDTASETWLHVIRDLDRFRGDLGAFRGWLFGIARHRALDERRRRSPLLVGAVDVPVPDAADAAIEGEGTDWALRVIASLPIDQAEAVMLRIVAGLDVHTTAHILGKRPGAIRVATMRGLRRLATHPQVHARTARTPAGEV
ncbi:RNA polymerase sigma factor [Paractinoplanes globisporus]|uniref:RNA polymerase sigma factor n=1 Tax=Paractinoplanes globisporus TaxID=113565 RepID=A0ABW6WIW8_9ACTN|nr:sigma-70 family RNA polymerase sigma factor [Actinoplanes globisporus]